MGATKAEIITFITGVEWLLLLWAASGLVIIVSVAGWNPDHHEYSSYGGYLVQVSTSPVAVTWLSNTVLLLPSLILSSTIPLLVRTYRSLGGQYLWKAACYLAAVYYLGHIGNDKVTVDPLWPLSEPWFFTPVLYSFFAGPFFLAVYISSSQTGSKRVAVSAGAGAMALGAFLLAKHTSYTVQFLPWLALAALVFLVDEKTRLIKLFIGLLSAMIVVRYGQLIALAEWGI